MNSHSTIEQQATASKLNVSNVTELFGRIGLAAIFFISGINKVQFYEGNAVFLASSGMPEWLLPAVITFELVGSVAIVIGFQVRILAVAFAGFSIVTALLYHNNLGDQIQFILFFKNIAMAGGFLVLASHTQSVRGNY
jgi:putative oxidoreductase